MRKRFVLLSFTVLLSLGGCVLDSTGGSASLRSDAGTGNGLSGSWDTTYSIQIVKSSNGVFILHSPTQNIYHWCSSNYDSLGKATTILAADTGRISDDTIHYLIAGNTLLTADIGDTTALPNGKYIRWEKFTRVGSGTGIQGTWNEIGDTAIPLAGLSASDPDLLKRLARYDSANALRIATYQAMQIEFSARAAVIRIDFGDWALQGLAEWLSYEAPYYKVTAKRINATTLTFTGADGVVATELHLDRNRTQYSSSNPTTYPTYVDIENPSSVAQCAENRWFYTFLSNYRITSSTSPRQAILSTPKPARKLWR